MCSFQINEGRKATPSKENNARKWDLGNETVNKCINNLSKNDFLYNSYNN